MSKRNTKKQLKKEAKVWVKEVKKEVKMWIRLFKLKKEN